LWIFARAGEEGEREDRRGDVAGEYSQHDTRVYQGDGAGPVLSFGVDKKRILIAVIAGLVGILAVARLRGGEARTVREDWPANFAHRGASARAPENTLEAFRLGMEAGAGGLELARGELAAETAPRSPGL
jgi:hypothetical protein